MKFLKWILLGLPLALILLSQIPQAETTAAIVMEELTFTVDYFATQRSSEQNVAVIAEGLTLADGQSSGQYTSPVIAAPKPFQVAFPQWVSQTPAGTAVQFQVRTSLDGQQWSPWNAVLEQDDWVRPGDSDITGDMILAPATDQTHQYLQFIVDLSRDPAIDQAAPLLSQLRFTLIDATRGPTSSELVDQQQAVNDVRGETTVTDPYPKPFVVSRDVWCTDPDCNYSSDDLRYYPVSHLIVHHTVTSNYDSNYNWASVVRAVWLYHAKTRDWGDIGYNYLVDPNGVLYEGHLGGDNVVGTHAAAGNRGTMALSLMGDFSTVTPSNAMLNAATELFAWKAAKENIDVFDASDTLPDVAWGLPHLMGHRDVYGGLNTSCPGTAAFVLLPWLRQQVADRIGLVDNRIYSQETSNEFSMSNPNLYWYVPGGKCGHNGHAYYTWSVTDSSRSTNWGEWRPTVPATGRYEIEVYAPFCKTSEPETDGARYVIAHAHGTSSVTISQDDGVGTWMSLGEFDLLGGQNTTIHLTDLTTTDSGKGVWFDSIRLRPIEATAVPTVPGDTSWIGRSVTFNWAVTSPITVVSTTLQVATDAGFNNLLLSQTWDTAVTHHDYTFDQDYTTLYWRVVLHTISGNQTISTPVSFGIDSVPPQSSIYKLYITAGRSYILQWSGSDTGAGLASYNIDMSIDGINWTPLVTNTTETMFSFYPDEANPVYSFRSQAIDLLGNTESPHNTADINTAHAILLPHAIMLPAIYVNQ